jgi:hypothetical protein
VEPDRVVEGLDVVEDGGACLGAAVQCPASEQILGQRVEKAYGDGVVMGKGAAARDLDASVAAALPEEQRHVLLALVGVMDQTRSWVSAGDGHLERVDDELGAQVVAHRPADDAARKQSTTAAR